MWERGGSKSWHGDRLQTPWCSLHDCRCSALNFAHVCMEAYWNMVIYTTAVTSQTDMSSPAAAAAPRCCLPVPFFRCCCETGSCCASSSSSSLLKSNWCSSIRLGLSHAALWSLKPCLTCRARQQLSQPPCLSPHVLHVVYGVYTDAVYYLLGRLRLGS